MLLDLLREKSSFYIYGAQVVAHGTYRAVYRLLGKKPTAFLVSDLQGNPTDIAGIVVRTAIEVPKDEFIVVAVTELLQREIVASLKQQGFRDLFCLTQQEEHLLMSAYFADMGKFLPADTTKVAAVDLAVYEVCNHRDKPLATHPPLKPFEYTIQAGADLTDRRIAKILDNTGQNISAKNRQYCEMTATYWVWKNTKHDWRGIEHYRRHLLVRPEMLGSDVDAILPLPYICYPNTLAQFHRFASERVLQALLRALQALHPREYKVYLAILQGEYQYTYNLLCARTTVFDDYCAWFFRITEYMETMSDEAPELANTRALSYVAEVLTNLYFMSHKELRLRHVGKEIFV